jgi:DNA-binding transcriptional ArsR family regulator
MPWVVHEVKPLPEKVAQAQQVLGHRLHIVIGHFLAGHPASRLGAIIESVGGERTTIRAHLKELEAAGVVTVDVPPDQRAGRTGFRYSVDRDRWFELGVRLISYLPAEPAEPRVTVPAAPPKPPKLPRSGQKLFPPPGEDDPDSPRVYWGRGGRATWPKFKHELTRLVAESAPEVVVVTYSEPGLGPMTFGHVVVAGQDLRIGPGEPLVLVDPTDPLTWRVGQRKIFRPIQ